MKKVASIQPNAIRSSPKSTLASTKEKRPSSSGGAARGPISEVRATRKSKYSTGGKIRDTDNGYDCNTETDGQKDGDVSLAWLYLSHEQIEDLKTCGPEEEILKLAQSMCMPLWKEDLLGSILMSYHHSNISFARECNFSTVQTGVFFSLMKQIFDKCNDRSFGVSQAVSEFKKMLLESTGVSAPRESQQNRQYPIDNSSWEVFGPTECKLIIDYATSTLFQHFKLIQYVLNNEQEGQEIILPTYLELPPTILPLAEAFTLEVYEAEKAAREQVECDTTDDNELLNAADLLEEIPPDELHHIVLDNVAAIMKGLSSDFDRILLDQRQKFLNQIAKLPIAKE
ncbi:hypothetical protein BASA62_005822 [Batrachochytrium salamandrivorans]|nr:hypothetical protein BASA62_005822 [Batrachochytrium salamandrivorans]